MTIRWIWGRAGSGKSETCLSEIRDKLIQQPTGHPLILLVPEQATFQSERRLASDPELCGTIRAQVLSFHRLAWRIMQEEGGTSLLPMNDLGKTLLIYHLLQQRRTELGIFNSISDQIGLVEKFNQLFTEFKRYRITPDQLEEQLHRDWESTASIQTFRNKMKDILPIYRDYMEHLAQGYLDAEDYLTLLARYIPESAYLQQAEVWIDGFHGYTPQEMQVIEQLFRCCKQVTLTLCIDRDYSTTEPLDECELFFPTARTCVELKQRMEQIGAPPPEIIFLPSPSPRYHQSPALQHLEQNFEFRFHPEAHHQYIETDHAQASLSSQVVVKEAVHYRAEVQGVAREILRLVRNEGVRFREIAIMVRHMDTYADLLRTTFAAMGIPHFFDQKRNVSHHPFMELIRASIEVVASRWSYDAVARCMKTELFMPAFAEKTEWRHRFNTLENYILAFGIREHRWVDEKPWTENMHLSVDLEEETRTEEERLNLQSLNETKEWIAQPLRAFVKRMSQAETVKNYISAVYVLLDQLQVAQKLEAWGQEAWQKGQPEQAKQHLKVWNDCMALFDQFAEMLGDESVTLQQFAGLLDTGLSELQMALVPPAIDQVLIGTMERSRSSGIQYGFLMGVNEGVIPANIQESSILNEQERAYLLDCGIRMADSTSSKLMQESFIIYTTLALPSQRLWMSYSLADEESKAILPSQLIKQIKRLFPSLQIDMIFGEPSLQMPEEVLKTYLLDRGQAQSFLAVQLKKWLLGNDIHRLWFALYNWLCNQPQWRIATQQMISSFAYENRETKLSEQMAQKIYGTETVTSVSQLEKFVACPFSHFASYGLRLKERRIQKLQAPDMGILFHDALYNFVQKIEQERIDLHNWVESDYMHYASQIVNEIAPKLQGSILTSSSRYQYYAHQLTQVVGRSSHILGLHALQSEFRPVGLEVAFGPGETIPPLLLPLQTGQSLLVKGKIDRVDHLRLERSDVQNYLRVLDYKSSQTLLEPNKIYHGLSLQLLTYLDVVVTHAKSWLGFEAFPAGALYFYMHNQTAKKENPLDEEKAKNEVHKLYKTKGYVLADPEIVTKMDTKFIDSTGNSILIPVEITTKGKFHSSHSKVWTAQEWTDLRSYARKQVTSIGERMVQGHLEIKPYQLKSHTPCTYCSYKPVCQYDKLFAGNSRHVLANLKDKEALARIQQSVNPHYAQTQENGGE